MDDMLGGTGNAGSIKKGSKSTGFSQAGMTAMISADSSLKQAKIQGSVATSMQAKLWRKRQRQIRQQKLLRV